MNDLENLSQLVAIGRTIRDAAEEIGIPEHAAYKLSRKDEFRARVSAIRTERTEALSAQALGASEDAIRELQTLATTAEKDSDRIAACKAILAKVLPLAENTELRRSYRSRRKGVYPVGGWIWEASRGNDQRATGWFRCEVASQLTGLG